MGINLNHSSAYSPQSNSHAERFVCSCKDILQKNKHLNQLQLDEFMLCVNSQVQPEGQCSAVDRFLGRSVISFIPNSFDNTFVWQDAIKKRAEVRERRVKKPARGSKESFLIGQQVLLQDHVSKKWDTPGEIINLRLAPNNKILSYEIQSVANIRIYSNIRIFLAEYEKKNSLRSVKK